MTKIESALVIGNVLNLCVYLECLAIGSVLGDSLLWSVLLAFSSVSQRGLDVLYLLANGKYMMCYICGLVASRFVIGCTKTDGTLELHHVCRS